MKYFVSFFILRFSFIFCSINVLRPRGVSLEKSSFYNPNQPFTCFDGSASIPFEHINDDYCDCNDGSDEPGTSACLNGSFHCNNIGYKPVAIPSSRVNDGYCDCCDASDEYASTANCIDECQALGEVARAEERRIVEEQMKGYNIRQQLAEEGLRIKKEKQAKLIELEKDKEKVDEERAQKEALKDAAEVPEKEALEKYRIIEEERKKQKEDEEQEHNKEEATEAFGELDVDQDGFLTPQDLQANPSFDTNKDGVVSEKEAMFYLHHEEDIDLDKFLNSVWMFVKPTYKYGRHTFTPPTSLEDELPHEQEEHELVEEEQEVEKKEYVPEETFTEDLEEDVDDSLPEDEDYSEDEEDDEEVKEEEAKDKVEYDEETQRLVDAASAARGEFEAVDRHLRDIVREMKQLKEGLEKDFGPNEEFRAMEGVCYEFSDREYTYKLCPFDYTVQKPLSGHGETRLGSWGHWDGPEDDKYSVMKYTGGVSCWNGPQRSAEVRLHCSTETQLTSVSEPNRCEYLFHFSTPALCRQPSDAPHQHTEL